MPQFIWHGGDPPRVGLGDFSELNSSMIFHLYLNYGIAKLKKRIYGEGRDQVEERGYINCGGLIKCGTFNEVKVV